MPHIRPMTDTLHCKVFYLPIFLLATLVRDSLTSLFAYDCGNCQSAEITVNLARMSLLEISSSVPMLAILRYALLRAGEDHLDGQGRLGCTRFVMLHSLHLPRMESCSRTWIFPANKIGTTGLWSTSILMTIICLLCKYAAVLEVP